MKVFVLFLSCTLLIVFCHGQSITEFIKISTDCKKKTNSGEDAVRSLMLNQIPQTKNGLCMMACICKRLGIMGNNNRMVVSKALEIFSSRTNVDQSKLGTVINSCKAEEQTNLKDECEAARLMIVCVVGKRSQLGI